MLVNRANALLNERHSIVLSDNDTGHLGVKSDPVCACPAVAGALAAGALADAGAFAGGAAVVTGAYALGKAVG